MTTDEAVLWLRAHDRCLILTHVRPDGDAIGCAAALCAALRKAGKTAYMLPNPETTEKYKMYCAPFLSPEGYTPDCTVAVDMAAVSLFPDNALQYSGSVDLCIDHHPSNSGYAKNLCLDASAAACGEIIYDIALKLCGSIDAETATLLYIAVSTDTGCFQYANTTGNSFRTAGALFDAGANVASVNKAIFRTKSRARCKVEGMILSGMEFYYGGQAAIVTLTNAMLADAGAGDDDLEDIASFPGAVEGVRCGITIRQLNGENSCKVSVRTGADVDANALCSHFGGGGHAMASGCSSDKMSVYEMKASLLCVLDGVFGCER